MAVFLSEPQAHFFLNIVQINQNYITVLYMDAHWYWLKDKTTAGVILSTVKKQV